ncbi:facilitated trehalose transporter Tret1 isoform X2 [Agrilus planipennis]|nr:facilitated trehalose transporter Tret1 isoform X2 [Agrilus planipennis]
MSIAFSGILVPDIEKPNSEIHATFGESSWIASVNSLTMAVSLVFVGFFTDNIGRLNTVRLSIIPWATGWALIALASNTTMLLVGRMIIGFAMSCASPGSVYLTETLWPNARGVLLALNCVTSSLGVELMYLKGLFLSWRAIAWCCVLYSVICTGLTFLLYESPTWLIKKGKIKQARQSLEWLHKYQTSPTNTSHADIHLGILKQENNIRRETRKDRKTWNHRISQFLKPTAYKPTIILIGVFLIQNFSGVYVIIAYSVTFFENVGSTVDPLIASNLVSGMPVILSLINLYTIKRFKRKHILIASCVGASICLFISGIFTKLTHNGLKGFGWVPILFIFLYMAIVMLGLEPIPWILACELFPLEMRGILAAFCVSTTTCTMFVAIYSYRYLDIAFGSAGVQLFYGIVAICGSLFVHYFIPETKGKTLYEIENYFQQ